MRGLLALALVALCCSSCAPSARNHPAPIQDKPTAVVFTTTDHAQIISSVIAARYGIVRESDPFVDECSVRKFLGGAGNVTALLRADVQKFVLSPEPQNCSDTSEAGNGKIRLTFKRIRAEPNGAVVECDYLFPQVGAHVETYRVRKTPGHSGKFFWIVTEILISDFVMI